MEQMAKDANLLLILELFFQRASKYIMERKFKISFWSVAGYWILFLVAKFAIRPLAYAYFRLHVRWLTPKPSRKEAVIFAANHVSLSDPFLMGLALGSHITFLAKSELFSGVLGTVLRLLRQIPVYRGDMGRSAVPIRAARERVLDHGGWLGIFPEGGTAKCHEPYVHLLKPGLAHLALKSNARLFAVGITGTSKVLPHSHKLPKPSKVRFVITEIDLAPYRAESFGAKTTRQLLHETQLTLARLTDQQVTTTSIDVCRAQKTPH